MELDGRVGAPTGQRDVRQSVLRQLANFPLHLLRDGEALRKRGDDRKPQSTGRCHHREDDYQQTEHQPLIANARYAIFLGQAHVNIKQTLLNATIAQ